MSDTTLQTHNLNHTEKLLLELTLSVNTTPNFQIWYLMSIDVILQRDGHCVCSAAFGTMNLEMKLNLPAEHGGVRLRLLLMRHGADVQRSQVHPEQLSNPLSAVDVPVFVQHLETPHTDVHLLPDGSLLKTWPNLTRPKLKTHLSLHKLVPVVVGEGAAWTERHGKDV